VRAVTGRPPVTSGQITEKLDFLIIVIVIAGPVVKSWNTRKEMALGAVLNHYVRENMYIRVNAPKSIRAIFQTSPKKLEKFGKVWRSLEKSGQSGLHYGTSRSHSEVSMLLTRTIGSCSSLQYRDDTVRHAKRSCRHSRRFLRQNKGWQRRLQVVVCEQLGPQLGNKAIME
jgi:hypothetical protein